MSGDLTAALTRWRVPGSVARRTVILPAGDCLAYAAVDWHEALVLLASGTI